MEISVDPSRKEHRGTKINMMLEEKLACEPISAKESYGYPGQNLVSTVGFDAGGSLGLAPRSPRVLCCPQYLLAQSQPGWMVSPCTLGDATAPCEGCLLQELPG
ncbi:hypothetical protein CB1_001512013 [Camelus ferus]|nr:hypothetical protein CB1_001512013 [Camelus ferus]